MERTWIEFVESTSFTSSLRQLPDDVLESIQNDLIQDPTRWPIIRGTNGARKGRVADTKSGRGKSGGFRYLYVYFPHRGRIHLLFMFAKHDQVNLSAAQKKVIARMIDAVTKER